MRGGHDHGQSAAQMTQSGVGQIVMTQSKQFLFLRNTDAAELRLITNYVPLSEDAQQNIRNFPTPEHLPPGRKFSSFLLVAQRPAGRCAEPDGITLLWRFWQPRQPREGCIAGWNG